MEKWKKRHLSFVRRYFSIKSINLNYLTQILHVIFQNDDNNGKGGGEAIERILVEWGREGKEN